MANETRGLSQFAYQLSYDDLSSDVVQKVKDLTIDQIGIQVACASLPWSKALVRTVQELGGNPLSTVVYYGFRTSPESAGFCNSSFGHGFELDDTHTRAINHPGCLGVPSAMAIGEWLHVSGRDFITAAAVAMELVLRTTLVSGAPLIEMGCNTHPASAPPGIAAGAAKLLRLDEEGILNAMGIAGSHAALGLREYASTGGTLKRTYGGVPVQIGIRGALLAKHGLTGPPTILEGKWGFLRVVCKQTDFSPILDGLGNEWVILETGIKRYCACLFAHTAIEGCEKIRQENAFAPDEIKMVTVGACKLGLLHVGTIREPRDIGSAQFSLAFSVALNLVKHGNSIQQYTEKNLTDPDVLRLSRQIRLVEDSEAEQEFPAKWASRVTIELKDGRVLSQYVNSVKGQWMDPMTHEDICEKFRELTAPMLSKVQQERLIKTMESLEDLPDISTLARQTVVG